MVKFWALVVIAATLALPAAAAEPAKTTQRVTGTIAFSAMTAGKNQVFVVRPGGRVTQLTHDAGGLFALAWSPDGLSLLATRAVPHALEPLYVVRGDGSGARRLTSAGAGASWSPDGRRIAFTTGSALVVIGADGSGRRVLARTSTPSGIAFGTSWSPDASRIVFAGSISGRKGLLTAATDGSEPPSRIPLTLPRVEGAGFPSEPEWSPAGTHIAFNYGPGVWVMRSDGSHPRQVAARGYSPTWSPDGSRLAVPGEDFNFVAATDGSGLRRLPGCMCRTGETTGPPHMSWSPDGRQVAYSGGLGPTYHGGIFTVVPDAFVKVGPGGTQVALSQRDQYTWPLWRPRLAG